MTQIQIVLAVLQGHGHFDWLVSHNPPHVRRAVLSALAQLGDPERIRRAAFHLCHARPRTGKALAYVLSLPHPPRQ